VTVHLPIFKSVTAIKNLHITYCSDNKLRHVRLLECKHCYKQPCLPMTHQPTVDVILKLIIPEKL